MNPNKNRYPHFSFFIRLQSLKPRSISVPSTVPILSKQLPKSIFTQSSRVQNILHKELAVKCFKQLFREVFQDLRLVYECRRVFKISIETVTGSENRPRLRTETKLLRIFHIQGALISNGSRVWDLMEPWSSDRV